jgi:transposase
LTWLTDAGEASLSPRTPRHSRDSSLLPRTRAPIVEPRATIARQSKAQRHQCGLIAPASRRLIRTRYMREMAAWALPPALHVRLTVLAEPWRLATRQRIEIRRLLRDQAVAPAALAQVYRSVPGIGAVVVRPLATERGERTRCAHERALCSSTGLPPSAYASGPAVRRGPSSRQGSGRVRHVLIETAWRALPREKVLQEMFDRLAATRGKQRAIVAMARRLTGRMRACVRQGTTDAVGT